MRNRVAVAAVTLLAATAGAADFDLGVKGGVNLAALSGAGLVDEVPGGDVQNRVFSILAGVSF